MALIKKSYFLITIFTIFVISLFIATFIFTANIVQNKQKENLILARDLAMAEINHHFHTIETHINDTAHYIELHSDNEIDILNYITEIANDNQLIFSIYLATPDLRMINSSAFEPLPGLDFSNRPWYILAENNEGINYTSSYINLSKDKMIVTISKALRNSDDSLYGILGADIDILAISTVIKETEIGEEGFAFLVDSEMQLIAYPDLSINLDEGPQTTDIFANIEENSGFIDEITIDNVKGVLAYSCCNENNYYIGVFMPLAEYSANLYLLRNISFITNLILIIASLLAFIVFKNRVQKPFSMLINDILAIDIENNISYRLDEFKNKEYKEVIKAINSALSSTDYFFHETIEAQNMLIIENQRVKLLMESTADIIFEINRDKRFISVYGKGINKLNMSSSDFIGKTIIDVFKEDGYERDRIYSKALEGKHIIYDWSIKKGDEILYFESSISPIYNEKNQIFGAVGISRDITEPMEKQKKVEYISTHDFLTDLYNRRYFVEAFARLNEEENFPLGLMMLDLNGLKILNDAYGHDIGDIALKKTAEFILKHSPQKAIVSRIGGDEFAIIITKTNANILESTKKSIQDALSKVVIKNVPLSIAIGYEITNDISEKLEDIIKNAENSMYRNKITEGKSIRNNTINAIFETLTTKHEQEKIHSKRVAHYSKELGKALGIKADDLKELELAGLYHDIGKITMADSILNKPGKLTENEFKIIKKHTENGYNILRAADQYSRLAEYALSHHEWWDGNGYPQGLIAEETPLFARIISICDAYEAMTSKRPYKDPISKEAAIMELKKYSGRQFDPKLTKIFINEVLIKE